jgi:hypothetical protein
MIGKGKLSSNTQTPVLEPNEHEKWRKHDTIKGENKISSDQLTEREFY